MTKATERMERSLLFSVIIFVNTYSIFFLILPLKAKYSYPLAAFISLFGFLTLLYATLCLCYRGFVEKSHLSGIELSSEARNCHVCLQFKPERSHHCSSCKRCVRKMDHHCHWLGRCINHDNHGHFIRFLLFMFFNSASILFFFSYYSYQLIKKKSIKISHKSAFVFVILVLITLLLVVLSFSHVNNQLYMLSKNITYIELFNCRNYGYSENDSPYNLGIKYNIESVLGPFKFLLLTKAVGDGMFFKKKYNVFYWPKHFRSKESTRA